MLTPFVGLFLLHSLPIASVISVQTGSAAKPASSAQPDALVEVPFKLGDNAIIVDAKVNGKKVSLMFDTGFGGHVICDDSINLGKPDGVMGLRDFVGQFEVGTVAVKSLKLGEKNIPVTDAQAVMMPGAENTSTYNVHCDGIMGFSVIKDTITEINFEKSKFIFHPSKMDITKRVPDNKRTFLAKLLPVGNSSLEMRVKTLDGKSMILALDTGNAFYGTTHKDVLERIGVWKPGRKADFMKQSGVASGPVDSFDFRMPSLDIFGVPVPSSVWSIIDLPSSSAEHDGTVGFGFLKNFNIIIDYQRRRVWLENFTNKVVDVERSDIGMFAYYFRDIKRTIVVYVTPGGPAEKAGVKVRDELLSIDDTEATNLSYKRMAQLMTGPTGTSVKLALSRGGSLMRVEVKRSAMVNELNP